MIDKSSKIFLGGHKGMVGSAINKILINQNYSNIITASRENLDLLNQRAVENYFKAEKPEYTIIAAAKVGGIKANITYPANFLYENLQIQNNLIHYSALYGVKKLVFLGSSCIYPKDSPQPMKEEYILNGKPEPTNEGYALAKIIGLKMCEYYYKQYNLNSICLMPPNLYGPNDSFDLEKSHVLSALVKRFVDAKVEGVEELKLWGSGIARREFMHVNDCARAVLYFFQNYDYINYINIGWGYDISIKELAIVIAELVGYNGNIIWDKTKPDGMLRKCMDVSKMKGTGFMPEILLKEGIEEMINNYIQLRNRKAVI